MPQHKPAPQNPGAGSTRLHRWIRKENKEVCAACGIEAGDRTRFSFCPGSKTKPEPRGE